MVENLGSFSSIQIVADFGNFTITGYDKENVLCKSNVDKARFLYNCDGKILKIFCSYKARWFQWPYLWISYLASGWPKANVDLFLPKGSSLDIRLFSGRLAINNLDNRSKIKMGSGIMRMEKCKGELDVFTSSADMTIKDFTGHLKLYSYTGDISVQGELLPDKPSSLESMMGFVKVFVKNANFSWTAKTPTGSVTMVGPNDYVQKAKKAAKGNLGAAQGKLSIKTNIGNVEIKTE